MKKHLIALVSAALACAAWADRTATQGYVDRATNATLVAATNYTDAALGAFAATCTVFRDSSVGNDERWTDATGCVWRVDMAWHTHEVADSFWSDYIPSWDTDHGGGSGEGWYVSSVFLSNDRNAVRLPENDAYFEYLGGVYWYRGVTNLVGRVALTNDVPAQLTPAQTNAVNSGINAQLVTNLNELVAGGPYLKSEGTTGPNSVRVRWDGTTLLYDDAEVTTGGPYLPLHSKADSAQDADRAVKASIAERISYGSSGVIYYNISECVWKLVNNSDDGPSNVATDASVRELLATEDISSTTAAANSTVGMAQGYTMTNTITRNSVVYQSVDFSFTFTIPAQVNDKATDWVVYLFSNGEKTLDFTAFDGKQLWMADAAYTNTTLGAADKSMVTAFYFSQMDADKYIVSRQELKEVRNVNGQ